MFKRIIIAVFILLAALSIFLYRFQTIDVNAPQHYGIKSISDLLQDVSKEEADISHPAENKIIVEDLKYYLFELKVRSALGLNSNAVGTVNKPPF